MRPRQDFQIVHHIVCRHRVEVEVCPPRAELYFHDERWIDPIDTQLRFEAIVYNSDRGVTWQVLAPDGGPGQGTIDATGLYQAPDKGGLASGTTDVVVATARGDPLRKAFAWVTLVGRGPLPAPVPRLEIWPKVATLYYQQGADNSYIDDRNKLRVFRAFPRHAAGSAVNWSVTGGAINVVGPDSTFATYVAPLSGGDAEQTVTATLASDPSVVDHAKIILLNYNWPGL
ncbi:MAG TPA: hypothetical protein VFA03_08590 [Acetobacteraceae bacterium]|nr:hypothetical protein [Acetobacteraceae bacterium]